VQNVSKPWWHKFSWMADDAGAIIDTDAQTGGGVQADFGY
jgi:hypothetical protein